MRRKSSMRLALAAVASAGALAAVAPGAQASYFDSTFSGGCKNADNLNGLGSSAQRSMFLDGFGATLGAPSPGGPNAVGFGYDAAADYPDCGVFKTPADGGTKTLSYRATGSGSCIDVFGGANSNDPRSYFDGSTTVTNVGFCGTDDPPTETQIGWMEQGPPVHSADSQVMTIPVAQLAMAAVVRLPDGCQVASGNDRQITRQLTNQAFEGTISTWGDIFGTKMTATSGGGLTNAQCRATQFVRVVRLDSSGSTFVFKRYLEQASHAAGGDSFDWRDPGEGGTLTNTAWPEGATAIIRGAANGAGSELDALSAQSASGGIAYADLATSRAKGYGWDQTGSSYTPEDGKFWLRVQRIANDAFVSPAVSNAQGATGGNAGAACQNVQYTNQVTSSDLGASWFPATAVGTAADFPICGLTYQLVSLWAFDTKNSRFTRVQAGATEGEIRAAKDFLRYELGVIRPGVGPGKLPTLGYAKLPADVLATAQAQTGKIGWLRGSTDPAPADPIT